MLLAAISSNLRSTKFYHCCSIICFVRLSKDKKWILLETTNNLTALISAVIDIWQFQVMGTPYAPTKQFLESVQRHRSLWRTHVQTDKQTSGVTTLSFYNVNDDIRGLTTFVRVNTLIHLCWNRMIRGMRCLVVQMISFIFFQFNVWATNIPFINSRTSYIALK